MSFWKRLFGATTPKEAAEEGPVGDPLEYKGYTIVATPFAADGQYQTCGVISRQVDGERKEHRFVRADRFGSVEDAASVALRKGQQIVDEQGDGIFR